MVPLYTVTPSTASVPRLVYYRPIYMCVTSCLDKCMQMKTYSLASRSMHEKGMFFLFYTPYHILGYYTGPTGNLYGKWCMVPSVHNVWI